MRAERRRQIVGAFARVLADHGYAGATILAVAAEAEVAPGLIHHHFDHKQDLLRELLRTLIETFRTRIADEGAGDDVERYIDAALRLDERTDTVAARCWVGVLAEAVRDPVLFDTVRRMLDREVETITRRSKGRYSTADSSAVLAFILGALVFGAFAPRKTKGFAAPSLKKMAKALG